MVSRPGGVGEKIIFKRKKNSPNVLKITSIRIAFYVVLKLLIQAVMNGIDTT